MQCSCSPSNCFLFEVCPSKRGVYQPKRQLFYLHGAVILTCSSTCTLVVIFVDSIHVHLYCYNIGDVVAFLIVILLTYSFPQIELVWRTLLFFSLRMQNSIGIIRYMSLTTLEGRKQKRNHCIKNLKCTLKVKMSSISNIGVK